MSNKLLLFTLSCLLLGCGSNGNNPSAEGSQPDGSPETLTGMDSVWVIVPEDEEAYWDLVVDQMDQIEPGEKVELAGAAFLKKKMAVQAGEDPIRAGAEAAAAAVSPRGGPDKASISEFHLRRDTAYVMLDIALDSWAGSSYSVAAINLLVEKTLLEHPVVNTVVFGYPPE